MSVQESSCSNSSCLPEENTIPFDEKNLSNDTVFTPNLSVSETSTSQSYSTDQAVIPSEFLSPTKETNMPSIRLMAPSPQIEEGSQFFAVSLPVSLEELNDEDLKTENDLVFGSAKEALCIVKKHKQARFKAFRTLQQALEFAKEVSGNRVFSTSTQVNPKIKSESVSSYYPTLKEQMFTKLRKAVECGNLALVQEMVDSNPKYLVSSCEVPVIVFAGARYNVLHVVAKANKPHVLSYLLSRISDSEYINYLFCDEDSYMVLKRRDHLLDLYLNTPDKMAFDTPLHIASKFGSFECLELLLEQPACDRTLRNKEGLLASEVICSRKGENDLKVKMINRFDYNHYIKIIGLPGTGDEFKVEICDGKVERTSRVKAIIGPMSPDSAKSTFQKLKNPSSRTYAEMMIRLSDHSDGFLRVARNYCKQHNIYWKEYWPFLASHVDIASTAGLEMLESYFENYLKKNAKSKAPNIDLLTSLLEKISLQTFDSVSDTFDQNDTSDDEFFTPPTSPYFTPPREEEYYINGLEISEIDKSTAVALVNTDLGEYPLVHDWYERVISQMSEPLNQSLYLLELSNLSSSMLNVSGYDSSFNESGPIKLRDIRSPAKNRPNYFDII